MSSWTQPTAIQQHPHPIKKKNNDDCLLMYQEGKVQEHTGVVGEIISQCGEKGMVCLRDGGWEGSRLSAEGWQGPQTAEERRDFTGIRQAPEWILRREKKAAAPLNSPAATKCVSCVTLFSCLLSQHTSHTSVRTWWRSSKQASPLLERDACDEGPPCSTKHFPGHHCEPLRWHPWVYFINSSNLTHSHKTMFCTDCVCLWRTCWSCGVIIQTPAFFIFFFQSSFILENVFKFAGHVYFHSSFPYFNNWTWMTCKLCCSSVFYNLTFYCKCLFCFTDPFFFKMVPWLCVGPLEKSWAGTRQLFLEHDEKCEVCMGSTVRVLHNLAHGQMLCDDTAAHRILSTLFMPPLCIEHTFLWQTLVHSYL